MRKLQNPILLLLGIAALCLAAFACNAPIPNPFSPNPTPTPTQTFAPTPSRTPLPTATPTPTATPQPMGILALAERDFQWGKWEEAYGEFSRVFETDPNPETKANALLGLAKIEIAQKKYADALDILRILESSFGETEAGRLAQFLLGDVYSALGRYLEAGAAYAKYLVQRPGILVVEANQRRGNALYAGGNYAGAIEAYQAGIAALQAEDGTALKIRLALAMAGARDFEGALNLLSELYNQTNNEYIRAEINWHRGQVHILRNEEAYAHVYYLESIEKFPFSYYSYMGLVELVNAGVPVNEYDRGLVDYYAAQHGVGIAAFDRYLLRTAEHRSEAHYYKGLSHRALNQPEAAITAWRQGIDEHTIAEPKIVDSWEEIGYTQWAFLGQYEEAIQTFLRFATSYPEHGRAPDFLFYAAQVSERNQQLNRAAEIWLQLASSYPAYPNAHRAVFLAGITQFRLQQFENALSSFQRAADISSGNEELAASLLWAGKSLSALGNPVEALNAWQSAAQIDPTGYYSERAAELTKGISPFAAPEIYSLNFDINASRTLAADWMVHQFTLPKEVLSSIPDYVAADPHFIRGSEFWKLGEFEKGRSEFDSLRLVYLNDPLVNFQLTHFFYETGLYRLAILCARQVLTLADMDDAATVTAPLYFNQIRFGPYYEELVVNAAAQENIDPLLLFSVIRQESLFEGFIRSSAGARGLMQIMPATGQGIYNQVGWPANYSDQDLFRPVVSVDFGAHYLAEQLRYLEGNIYAALAGYNAGPGNAKIWSDLAGNDPDLFLEIVRFEETRRYIRGIYEMYQLYYQFYDRTP